MTATRPCFKKDEQKAFEPAEKIGIVACVNPDGQPHVSLITSIMAPHPNPLTLGEFCRGAQQTVHPAEPTDRFSDHDDGSPPVAWACALDPSAPGRS